MADWVDLLLVVQELAGRALLTREEAGAHVQTALINKEIRTRARLRVPEDAARAKFTLNADDELSDIPAEFWKNIAADWHLDSPYPFAFFIEMDRLNRIFGNTITAFRVEASRVEALTFLRRFDKVSGTENETSIS